MHAPHDARLWSHVQRSVTPLGQPSPGRRLLVPLPVRSPGVDLHGDTLQGAYERVRDAIDRARDGNRRDLVVVTGRSGGIRVEFPAWAALHPGVRSFEPLNGGGAYRVRLRVRRQP